MSGAPPAGGPTSADENWRNLASLRTEVDPFIGTGVTDLPPSTGLAATWWWPKPPVGNTHPGACHPFGMVSASAHSGAYPTGYGVHDAGTEGVPHRLFDEISASGFTHFHQSGTGAIRKYYNYLRVTPMISPLDDLGTRWPLHAEWATTGAYGATLSNDIAAEVTVGPKSAVHRYRFPAHDDARIVLDFSAGGLSIEHGRTVPTRAGLQIVGPGVAWGELVVEGIPLTVWIEADVPDWRQMLWYDRRLMAGGSHLEFDAIRETTLRPFGLLFRGPSTPDRPVEIRLGFSLRGADRARKNLEDDCGRRRSSFDRRRAETEIAWADMLDRVSPVGGSSEQRTVFATALYHSLIKPCFAPDESPFWRSGGPFVFDICTMWDIYKTQLPLLTLISPDRAVELLTALLRVSEEEGNLPIGYRMARGADRFFRQASALAHTALADVAALGLGGIDWEWALLHMHADLRRTYGEDYLEHGIAHPITHTLDLAYGYHCTARVARRIGDDVLADRLDAHASGWERAFDPDTGLLVDSTYYEGGRWNYSFRLLHDMAGRIELAGGDDAFVALLDRFFGFGAEPVKQLGESPSNDEVLAGYALNRFEGLNNEPDMEAPWAYHYAGRPDRTAEVVHAIIEHQFAPGRGGLPGNDDSGGLSSWYVWASIGLFPVAGQGIFLVNAPAFRGCRLRVAGGLFEITTDGFDAADEETGTGAGNPAGVPGVSDVDSPRRPARYVASIEFDGQPLDRTYLTQAEVHSGGTLHIVLADRPTSWGRAHRPPSHPTTATNTNEGEP